ncbi:hypothetical protein CDL12_02286 [Handroanthus impetiginosus]|uniref:Uncharacterized protein n=1 Tax=Handroanthus impetiginosus TaxID=429701 RepID=A0A2G9I5D5_9LAMI|nr:hypothetical protein CDL12_02286 [Handroanthus impetiginosus]
MEFDFTSEEMRDFLMDIDFLFSPKEEKLLSMETDGQLVLPEIPENDTMLEQLLLSNPLTEDEQLAELEAETCTDSGVHVGLTLQPKEYDESHGSDDDGDKYQNQITEAKNFQSPIGTSEKVDVLTKQMGSLTSEIS